MAAPKSIVVSGKRKRAIAKATIKAGKGTIRINKQLLKTIEPEISRLRLQEPLEIAENLKDKVNINITMQGGGSQSQIEAARLTIAKALLAFSNNNAELKQSFLNYDRHLLIADTRRNEPHKPNDSKPRAKRQFSKR
jgi:small subunit ribosomal protein S9